MRRPLLSLVVSALPLVFSTVPASGAPAVLREVVTDTRALPAGWSIDGAALVWTTTNAQPIGSARPEFRVDGVVIGHPREVGRSLRLDGAAPAAFTGELSVWRSGRRLDAPAPTPLAPDVTSPVDTARPGRSDPTRADARVTWRRQYRLEPLDVPGLAEPVEVIGEVTAPADVRGDLPIVVLLHGRHGTCFRGDDASGDWPCRRGWRSIPSFEGYRYIADRLAAQGNVVVSISANGVNGQDAMLLDGGAGARSRLVRHHLAAWARWTRAGGDPWGGRFRGHVDLSAVVLLGHSRGGEGVVRAAIDSSASDPWTIRGLLLVAPTDFTRQAAPGAHTVVLLPACDGDVSDLQGQQYVDVGRDAVVDGALRSAVFVPGANHNFFNTEWTPGISVAPAEDDVIYGGRCQTASVFRLSAARQRSVGLAYTAALTRLVTRSDRSALAYLDGSPAVPPTLVGTGVFVTAVGGAAQRVTVRARPVGSATVSTCRGRGGSVGRGAPMRACLAHETSPHFLPPDAGRRVPPPRAVRLDWNRRGAGARFTLGADLSAADSIDMRVIVPADTGPTSFRVRVTDGSGRRADVVTRTLDPPTRRWDVARHLRVPLSLLPARLDRSRIRSVDLVAERGSGSAVVLDLWVRTNTLPRIREIDLPRVGATRIRLAEGSTRRTVDLSLVVTGSPARTGRIFVQLNLPDYTDSGRVVVVRPGRTVTLRLPILGNTVYDGTPRDTTVSLYALSGAVVTRTYGGATVREDDAPPTMTIEATDVRATEGQPLTWTMRLSESVPFVIGWELRCRDDATHPISTADVTPDAVVAQPDPPTAVCATGLTSSFVFFDRDQTVTSVSIGTVDDGIAEPAERVGLTVVANIDDPFLDADLALRGTIDASP